MLRFAILKQLGGTGKDSKVVLEYDEEQLLSRLQARVREGLAEKETFLKHMWTKAQVAKAVDGAFRDLVSEFKEETIKIT